MTSGDDGRLLLLLLLLLLPLCVWRVCCLLKNEYFILNFSLSKM